MTAIRDALLVLDDGAVFEGEALGATPPTGVATGEVVFNTVLSGYQEVISDPSYAGQIITFTYPHIGNYGVTGLDDEYRRPFCRGVVVRDLARRRSNWRSTQDLDSWLTAQAIPGIGGIDTRRLTRHIRDTGARPGAFGALGEAPDGSVVDEARLRTAAQAEPGTDGIDLVSQVTTSAPYSVGSPDAPFRVVAYDFGIKTTILRHLAGLAQVVVVPAGTTAEEVLAHEPHGVFLSNGPGDPATVPAAVDAIRTMLGQVPIFGICLGHQLLATALGAEITKLPFGHHGGNHPVQRLSDGVVEITSQNHNFAVVADSLVGAEVTHLNLNDGVVEGIRATDVPAFSVQHHPEAGPGPHDASYLFSDFAALMSQVQGRLGATTISVPTPPLRPTHLEPVGLVEGHLGRTTTGGSSLMPRRDDIASILLIGSGPIVIGQACEFDYSGTQACRILREEGYRVILANSNPATIMTDPDFADATYVEPLDLDILTKIIEKERPDALLPTLGGQTALNLAMELVEAGVLETHGVELIGADAEAIATAEDRQRFKEAMIEIGLEVPASGVASPPRELKHAPKGQKVIAAMEEARRVVADIGLPVVIRPAYILGGKGTGIAATTEQFERVASAGLDASPITEILIEKSIAGWKEYELEVMRDRADNCVIVCSIENVDPMGVHTGDSITVAPAQTLSDVEYQRMRNAALACIRRVGVETGGSNVQFAINPENGDMVVIEMNPRVSRSSALASKATGFPIAKIAARLAVGYTLDEIPNDITRKTPASFEPTIDYVVTKVPRWAFEKFPGQEPVLGTQMQSVGEAMAIGRTFPESLQKALRSLEQGRLGLNGDPGEAAYDDLDDDELVAQASIGTPDRPFQLEAAIRRGIGLDRIYAATRVDPWFLDQMSLITEERAVLETVGFAGMDRRSWRRAKRLGFGDAQLAHLWGESEEVVRAARLDAGVRATFKTVDTCGAEFDAETPYHYSTYEDEDEVRPGSGPKVLILGSGPNRIGQGIEFDYCCVHASFALQDAGYETIMLNCNPETVSTDYDTSDRLYFEPLTYEDVMNVIEAESAAGGELVGVIVSLGGQTPLKLSGRLPEGMVLGTSAASIDLAEDREGWNVLCNRLGIPQPAGGTATDFEAAKAIADEISYPVLVRPSYVLGGRAMEIVYDEEQLRTAMAQLAGFGSLGREGGLSAERPVLVDRFLEDATEVDVDAIRDATGETLIGGVMEHIEEAGVHSGDSACAIPPYSLVAETVATIEAHTRAIADALDVKGLINVQFAVRDGDVFVIEANPRASRTVPFVAKATGVPLVKVASRVMLGATLEELRAEGLLVPPNTAGHVAVKEAVLPFNRFPDADRVLGPEMRSTGEVMGIDRSFGLAFAKSQIAAGDRLPESGTVFFSLADRDKVAGVKAARRYVDLGFDLVATAGTADALEAAGLPVLRRLAKVTEGEGGVADGPTAVDLIASGEIQMVVNSPRGRGPRADGGYIRSAAGVAGIPLLTTASAALAAADGMADWSSHPLEVKALQEYHPR